MTASTGTDERRLNEAWSTAHGYAETSGCVGAAFWAVRLAFFKGIESGRASLGAAQVPTEHDVRTVCCGRRECGGECGNEWQGMEPSPKPLDDPRLQQAFGDAIEGALAFGFQGNNAPPEGHWLTRFWNIGRAEATKGAAQVPARSTLVSEDWLKKAEEAIYDMELFGHIWSGEEWCPTKPISAGAAQVPSQDAKDAARYRMVRRGQHWSVIDGIGDTLCAEVLDAAVDAALSPATEAVPSKGEAK